MDIISHYAKYDGDNSDLLIFSNKFFVYLSDFEFVHNKKIYKIILGKKGDNCRWHRFKIDDKSYVSNNVWFGDFDSTEPINESDITENDIIVNNLSFIESDEKRERIKEYFVNQIKEEAEEEQRKEQELNEYWKDKETILHITDDGEQVIYYIIKDNSRNVYRIYLTAESLLWYMHSIGDDYLRKECNSLEKIYR